MAPPINSPQFGQFGTNAAPIANQAGSQAGQNSNDPTLIPDKAKQPVGTGYTNLQTILNANQGNQLGNAVTGEVAGAGNTTRQNLASQQQQFGQGITAAQGTLAGQQNTVNQGFQNYDTSGTAAPGAAQGFSDLRNAQYNGPQTLGNTQQLQQQAATAQQYGQMGQSAGGRQQLLQQTVGTPGYTQSQQALDQLLISPSSQGALRSAGLQNQRLGGQVNQAIAGAQNAGTAQANALQQLQQQAAGGISSRQGTVQNAVQRQVQQAQQANTPQQAQNAALQAALQNPNLNSVDALVKGGLTPQQAQSLVSLNTYNNLLGTPQSGQQLSSVLNYGNVDTSAAGNTTQQQINQQNALASLAGTPQQYTYTAPGTTQTGVNNANAAAYAQGLIGQNTNALTADQAKVAADQQNYTNQLNQLYFQGMSPDQAKAQLDNPNSQYYQQGYGGTQQVYGAYVSPYLQAQYATQQDTDRQAALNKILSQYQS